MSKKNQYQHPILGIVINSIDDILSKIEDAPLYEYDELVKRVGDSISELRVMKEVLKEFKKKEAPTPQAS